MKSEMLIYGQKILVILDEMGEVSFEKLEEKSETKGEELKELLKYLVGKNYLKYSLRPFIATSSGIEYFGDSKVKLLPEGMEVILGKRDYFSGREKIPSKDKTKIIFDSNIYDLIANGKLNINLILEKRENFEFYITHIQIDEINKCLNEDKRARLSLFKSKLSPLVLPTESGIYGVSRYGEAKYGDGDLLEKLQKGNIKHAEDALIGETAIKNNLILVTEDIQLRNKVLSLNGKAISLNEFKEMLK